MNTNDTPTASCDFPGHPGPAGHVNSCKLCPASPTYWRDRAAADSTKPCRWTETKRAQAGQARAGAGIEPSTAPIGRHPADREEAA